MAEEYDPQWYELERSRKVDPRKAPLPYTAAGLPSLQVREAPELKGTNTKGFVYSSGAKGADDSNRAAAQAIYVADPQDRQTLAHETEHLLARQNLGAGHRTQAKFQELMFGNGNDGWHEYLAFQKNLVSAAPYIKEKYGVKSGYLDPKFLASPKADNALDEILATLAGIESANGVDLTKDPVLRDSIFKHRKVREAYNAVTGLRQTRTDAKDLPPYTILPEKPEPGMIGKIKHLMGYANGGAIPNAGNNKLI